MSLREVTCHPMSLASGENGFGRMNRKVQQVPSWDVQGQKWLQPKGQYWVCTKMSGAWSQKAQMPWPLYTSEM